MKRLIVNADDFGLTEGCNLGIIKAMKEGIVTGTTVMINMPAAEEGLQLAKEAGIKELGLHLTLTCGRPVLPAEEVPSLVDGEGNFYRRRAQLLPVVRMEDVEKELKAQTLKFLSYDMTLSHLDSHHHIHMDEKVWLIAATLAKDLDVPLRQTYKGNKKDFEDFGIRTTNYFSMDFYGEGATLENFKRIMEEIPEGTMEIMTHPAMVEESLLKISSYTEDRAKELEILTSKAVKDWLREQGIILTRFSELRD